MSDTASTLLPLALLASSVGYTLINRYFKPTKISVSAPGKLILFGEHAVVYHKKAIATSLDDLRATIDLTLENSSSPVLSMYAPQVDINGLKIPLQELDKIQLTSVVDDILTFTPKVDDNVLNQFATLINNTIASLQVSPLTSNSKVVSMMAAMYLYKYLSRGKQRRTIRLDLSTTLPIGAGLGSSASFSVCLATGILAANGYIRQTSNLNAAELNLINKWAYFCEELIHGTPSGIDNTVATFGGVVSFIKGQTPEKLDTIPGNLKILIVDTGVPRNTKQLVAGVRERYDQNAEQYKQWMDEIEKCSNDCLDLFSKMKNNEITSDSYSESLKVLIDNNQRLLVNIGVGHDSLQNIVDIAAQYKLHAKLTGAGGGGCAFVLLSNDDNVNHQFKQHLSRENLNYYESTVGHQGVLISNNH